MMIRYTVVDVTTYDSLLATQRSDSTTNQGVCLHIYDKRL